MRGVRLTSDDQTAGPLSFAPRSYSDAGYPSTIARYQGAAPPEVSASEADQPLQPGVQFDGQLTGPPAARFSPPPGTGQGRPRATAYVHPGQPKSAPASSVNPVHQFAAPSQSRAGQTIAYGALRAPAPSDQELAELRRQQAAFADTTRKIDLQNSWFAVPGLAPPLVALGLGAAGEWVTGEIAPAAGRAVANFVERAPYLRVGDNWATRAGRRAHAALRERVAQKPGWDPEPTITLDDGAIIRPDVRTPVRIRGSKPEPEQFLMELKPNTPSGLKASARAVRKYEELTG